MRELLRSNDAVLINYAEAVLRQNGIVCMVADQHISVIEGSIGAFPRRLLVGEHDWRSAHDLLLEAGLEREVLSGEAGA